MKIRFTSSLILVVLSIKLSACSSPKSMPYGSYIFGLPQRELSELRKENEEEIKPFISLSRALSAGEFRLSEIPEYEMPSFPWPPPLSSTIQLIPRNFLEKKKPNSIT